MKFKKSFFLLAFFLLLFFTLEIFPQDFNRPRTYDIQHYKIHVRFDRARKQVFGDTTVSLKPLRDNFKSIELDANGINFNSVQMENGSKELNYKVSEEKISVELEKNYKKGELINIRFQYSCKPKKGIYFVEEKKDGNKIVHSEQIWTQGEADEARFWFPSYDFPDDKATSEQFITARSDENVIANGELIDKKDNGDGTTVFHFKMNIPHSTYLTSFVIGTYFTKTDFYKKIPLTYSVYPGEESIIPLVFTDTKEMIRVFEEATKVEYPYNKYDQTIVDNFQFGGMENITATTYSDKEIFYARFPQLRGFSVDLVSHELAHSWFGNLVTCKNWAELWLNEGFATYMEAVYRGKVYGQDAYKAKIREDATVYLYGDAGNNTKHGLYNLTANDTEKLFKYPNITYNKGSVVIHLLHETVGDETFWKAINIYLNKFKFANVESSDFKKVLEETSGKNLDQFFKQWVYAVGHPKLEVESVFSPADKTLRVTISQTQKGDKVPAVFVFPLEITVLKKTGEKTEIVIIDKRIQNLSIKLDEVPVNVLLDKNAKMPLFSYKISSIKGL
ncbi:MAG: M1 family aminopeptidase [Pyrinomonadaceae bacterium]